MLPNVKIDPIHQYKTYGYWTTPEFLPGMYMKKEKNKVYFRGLIATYRKYQGSTTFVTLGIDNGSYVDITIKKKVALSKKDIISGEGYYSGFMVNVSKFAVFSY